jgi:hypothetical protein
VLKKFFDVEIAVTKLDRPVWDIVISSASVPASERAGTPA